ncbi:hypothetical protein [Clostridium beijerinckii]|nr:hypothetical protein [Clostridium beijerinckii]
MGCLYNLKGISEVKFIVVYCGRFKIGYNTIEVMEGGSIWFI